MFFFSSNKIPIFPKFRKVNIKDRNLFSQLLAKSNTPYSDLASSSVFGWGYKNNETKISDLNNNILLKFHRNGAPDFIVSLHGNNNLEQSIYTILESSDIIFLLPTGSINQIKLNPKLQITPVRDDFDYIYDTLELINLDEYEKHTKKLSITSFIKDHQNVNVKLIDLTERGTSRKLLALYNDWTDTKYIYNNSTSFRFEQNALHFTIRNAGKINYFALGVFINNNLVGFSINEILNKDYVLGSFMKTSLKIRGLSDFLVHETAYHAYRRGIRYMNLDCDLGIEGLRMSKLAWKPKKLLEKYTVMYKD